MKTGNLLLTPPGVLSLFAISAMLGYAAYALGPPAQRSASAYALELGPQAASFQQAEPECRQRWGIHGNDRRRWAEFCAEDFVRGDMQSGHGFESQALRR